jgi:4-carboxymuconolactone decarboxylase
MSVNDVALGRRLALYDREALDLAQMELFDWQMSKAVPWAHNAGFQAGTETRQLIEPFNRALLSLAIPKAFIDYMLVEHENTSLSTRAREAVILTVGAAWQAAYELYAHCAVGRHIGLSPLTKCISSPRAGFRGISAIMKRPPIASRVP